MTLWFAGQFLWYLCCCFLLVFGERGIGLLDGLRKRFQGNRAVQAGVPGLVHRSHPALPEFLTDLEAHQWRSNRTPGAMSVRPRSCGRTGCLPGPTTRCTRVTTAWTWISGSGPMAWDSMKAKRTPGVYNIVNAADNDRDGVPDCGAGGAARHRCGAGVQLWHYHRTRRPRHLGTRSEGTLGPFQH